MDSFIAILLLLALAAGSFQLGRWFQICRSGIRLARIAHIDQQWEDDCKETRELALEVRGLLQTLPWWRG